jgi:hypothetical protein
MKEDLMKDLEESGVLKVKIDVGRACDGKYSLES